MFKLIFRLRLIFNLFFRYKISTMGNISLVNLSKRRTPIIVSLTSKEENFYDLELTLYSLFNQTVKPDRIILWLSNNYSLVDLPYGITGFVKNGLEIRFVKDLGDYSKIIYPLKEFSGNIIVTTSDCIYYEKDWLKKLFHSYIAKPNDIHAHSASYVTRIENSENQLIYKIPTVFADEESAKFNNFAIGYGGILYPPDCFRKEVFREDIYSKLQGSSDVWMWVMSILSDRKTRIVKSHNKTLSCINIIKFLIRYFANNNHDKQIKFLTEFYAQNIEQKLK